MPVLENSKGQLVYESAITCEYLDEAYPAKKLLPEDPYEKACQKMSFELFSKVCILEISAPIWKIFAFLSYSSAVIYGSVLWERKTKQDYSLVSSNVSFKPFLDQFLFTSPKLPPFHFSTDTLYYSHNECFQFSQTRHLIDSCWKTLPLLTLPGHLQILFHVSAQILLPSRNLSRRAACSTLFHHGLTFPRQWLLAFLPGVLHQGCEQLVRVKAVFPLLLAHCLCFWLALPLPSCVTLSKLLIALPLCLN